MKNVKVKLVMPEKPKIVLAGSGQNTIHMSPEGVRYTHCNRCGRTLTAESSLIRGVGPVCARRALKALGNKVRQSGFQESIHDLVLTYFDAIVRALSDESLTMDHEKTHRTKLQTVDQTARPYLAAIETAYEVLGDVANQLPTTFLVATSVEDLFNYIGAKEEGEKARKRLIKIAQKVGTF